MFNHRFLLHLAELTCEIQKRNEKMRETVYVKGENGQDVVSGSDFENERLLRVLLKKNVPDLLFIYGEENGYETVINAGDEAGRPSDRPGNQGHPAECELIGKYGALIDPIDGTRTYTASIFYSGISVAFVNLEGQTIAGFVILLNNQWKDDYTIWTFDGKDSWKNGKKYEKKERATSLKQSCISVTNVASFPDDSRAVAAILFKLAADRSRGVMSFCSGAAEAMCVVEGKLDTFINLVKNDVVSHAVVVEIAKSLGMYVRHVFRATDDFSVRIDIEKGSLEPGDDMSVVIAPAGLKQDVNRLITDALSMYGQSTIGRIRDAR